MNTAPLQPSLLHGVIAIVDDDQSITSALAMWLKFYDIGVRSHHSAESLLQDIGSDSENLVLHAMESTNADVPLLGAILDVNLPCMNGFELANALRQLKPNLPIIMITALNASERQQYGAINDNILCLSKPFDLNALENVLFPLLH